MMLMLFLCPGVVMLDVGEAMRELGEVKDALDMEVKQNFIDPLQNLHDKDVKEIQVHNTPYTLHTTAHYHPIEHSTTHYNTLYLHTYNTLELNYTL